MSVSKKILIFIIFIVIALLSVSCSTKPDSNNPEIPIPDGPSLGVNSQQNNSLPAEEALTKKEPVSFSGYWNRTEIIRAGASSLKITNETDNNFDFELDTFWGDHFGVLSGTAVKDTLGKAEFTIEAAGYHNGGVLGFVMDEEIKNLNLSFEGDIAALDFGQNVVPDGVYVLGEPYYVSDNYPLLVFGNEKIQDKIRKLMTETNENRDDTAYHMLLKVMKEGLPELVEPGRYKGFIGSGHETGVDLYISPKEEICIMTYGLEEGQYVFYTSEVIYHGWMTYPEYLVIPDWISREDISFKYCGYYGE